tara:strand:+ start:300 stop:527 length:228 start_codon:yes stop_codon:yes gene_type:complete
MKNAWIIFVIYLLVKGSILGVRQINKHQYHSSNQPTYGTTTKGMPKWLPKLVKRVDTESEDISRLEKLNIGNKNK